MRVEFFRHGVDEADIEQLVNVCRGVFLTTGEEVQHFEGGFSSYLGLPRAVGVTSCTAALHLSLLALDVGPGDEVVTTPMTFAATANAILYTGATPIFVDVEPATGLIDADAVEDALSDRTKAILPVHLYGQMADMRRLRAIADRRGLSIVEDCAHAIEAERDGVRPGALSEAACFSFYATKNITCGEGGAVATRSEALADRVKLLRSHGMSATASDRYTGRFRHWDLEALGWKYNMTNLQAALLQGQLKRIDTLWARREALSRRYEEGLAGVPGIELPEVRSDGRSARHLFTLWVDPEERDRVLSELQERQIGVAVNYRAVHLLRYYRERFGYTPGTFPASERIGASTVTVPLYPKLSEPEVDYVVESLRDIVGTA